MVVKTNAFVDFLLEEMPHFDELIIKDVKPTDGWLMPYLEVLPIDVRLLPASYRPIFRLTRFCHLSAKKISRKLRIRYTRVLKIRAYAEDIIIDRLNKWLKTLPKHKRIAERRKRQREMIDRGVFASLNTYPRISDEWIRTEDTFSIGKPVDPTPK